MTKALKNHINCSEMLNGIQEHKHCNIPFQELIEDHFGVEGREIGIISVSVSFIISGSIWGSFRGMYSTLL